MSQIKCRKCNRLSSHENMKGEICYYCWLEQTYNWIPAHISHKAGSKKRKVAEKEINTEELLQIPMVQKNSRTCAMCTNRKLLEDFSRCTGCGQYYCSECNSSKCETCKKRLCKDCRIQSEVSEAYLCRTHAKKCFSCFKNVGIHELRRCVTCKDYFCKNCSQNECYVCNEHVCVTCQKMSHDHKVLCEDHIRRCYSCAELVATKDLTICSTCGNYFCETCGPFRCSVCDKRLCHGCREESELSSVSLCHQHIIRCDGCKREVSSWEMKKCKGCGDYYCLDCECKVCK